jgi:curved DNA-binding protein CbpA
MSDIDYYSVLGVSPSADDVVIRAAYRALAQRYHPDKWGGDLKVANERMAELNAAFAVLSDAEKRKEYDGLQSARGFGDPFSGTESEDAEPPYDPLTDDWELAVSFYPDLRHTEAELNDLSWRVAAAYRAQLLATQGFEQRSQLAQRIKSDWYRRHFGTNQDIIEFAESLMKHGNLKAALALNKAVRVLGSMPDATRVIERVAQDYCPANFETPVTQQRHRKRIELAESEAGVEFFTKIGILIGFIVFVALVMAISSSSP